VTFQEYDDFKLKEAKKGSDDDFFQKFMLNDSPVLFEKFCEGFGLNDAVFELKILEKLYGNVKVDVINQRSWKEIEGIGCELNNSKYFNLLIFFFIV